MAFVSTRVAQEPRSSIFDIPELVGLVAQYLSGHDIIQCMATNKAWERLFEPFVWQDVVLKSALPAPQAMARNRHRIRSLQVVHNDYINLCTLADDLQSVTLFSPDDLNLPSDSSKSYDSIVSSSTTGNNIFKSLREIHIVNAYHYGTIDKKKRSLYPDYIFRIIDQSPGLLRATLEGQILNQSDSQVQSLLYLLGHKLPCLKWLYFTNARIDLDIGLELMRACFNHPQLVGLYCKFSMRETGYSRSEKSQRLNAFLSVLENDKKTREAPGEPVVGSRIKSLVLPEPQDGYPPDFICSLLRSHLPNLECFTVPEIYDDDDKSYTDSLKKAVAQGCPKLQHIELSWSEYEESINEAVDGMIQGCKEMSLKSFYCDGFEDMYSQPAMKILLEDHSTTLEEIELTYCKWIDPSNFMGFFSMCKNLRRFVVTPSKNGDAIMSFQDMVLQEWVCHDLKELELTITRPRVGLGGREEDEEEDEEEDDEDEEKGDPEESELEYGRAMAKQGYGQIGRLSKLEMLCLGCETRQEPDTPEKDFEYDLTLERGWLGELAGLKELRHLQMATDFWSKMGQAEVEFMDANWPKLEKITFGCYGLSDSPRKAHWIWLQKKRPHLQYRL
ncbi:MAG: hypothetical protein J3Q66DRAFT_330802 [Benniella sp.]|nr:MAG: hypothetical protein J3Q66DRAFT_330802 [Benniella sp.]